MSYLKSIITGVGLVTATVCSTNAFAEKRPNIIFLLADDQATRTVGVYGHKDVKTPNMDKLGTDGVIFDNHYDTTSICMASRANIMTGMYEYKTGTNFSHGDMKPSIWAKSYPVLLRDAGYYVGFAGKFGFEIEGEKNGTQGKYFDMWGGGKGQTSFATSENKSMAHYADKYPHSTLSYGAFGQDFIKNAVDTNKPFCLSISFKAPHRPVQPDPKFNHIYKETTFTKPVNFGREFGKHMSKQSKTDRQYENFIKWKYDSDYDGVMRLYNQQVYAIDVAVGMLREELERQGIADNTVIIYTSDNGYISGSHGYGAKVLPYEESTRVPLMIYDPRSGSSGKKMRSSALTGNIDFAPTILDLAGLPIPENIDGKSLREVIEEPSVEVHDSLALMNYYGKESVRYLGVVTKEWKYTYWWYGTDGMEPTEELFHLVKDPYELKNAAVNPEYSKALEAMRTKYDKRINHFKQQVVAHNDYSRYGTLFDRSVQWEDKIAVIPKKSESKKRGQKGKKR